MVVISLLVLSGLGVLALMSAQVLGLRPCSPTAGRKRARSPSPNAAVVTVAPVNNKAPSPQRVELARWCSELTSVFFEANDAVDQIARGHPVPPFNTTPNVHPIDPTMSAQAVWRACQLALRVLAGQRRKPRYTPEQIRVLVPTCLALVHHVSDMSDNGAGWDMFQIDHWIRNRTQGAVTGRGLRSVSVELLRKVSFEALYPLSAECNDPLSLLARFRFDYNRERRERLRQAREAHFAALSLEAQLDLGHCRLAELQDEFYFPYAPEERPAQRRALLHTTTTTTTEETDEERERRWLQPLGLSVAQSLWNTGEAAEREPELAEPSWYLVEALVLPSLVPNAALATAAQRSLSTDKVPGLEAHVRQFETYARSSLIDPLFAVRELARVVLDEDTDALFERLGLPTEWRDKMPVVVKLLCAWRRCTVLWKP